MIYESVKPDEPIRQGDIFKNVPRVDLSLANLAVAEDDNHRLTRWRDLVSEGSTTQGITAVLPIKAVTAIVITQDCDAVRGQYLSLCQMDEYLSALNLKDPPASPKKWQSLIVERARTNPRLVYFPAAPENGLNERMAVDFRVILRLPRTDMESLREFRVGRLNTTAAEHFRETLAHFFRRYAFNEWYPLTKEEFDEYAKERREAIEAYPWQLSSAPSTTT